MGEIPLNRNGKHLFGDGDIVWTFRENLKKFIRELHCLANNVNITGGFAPIYYANTLIKFTAKVGDKRTVDKHGFDGFDVRCDFLKSRTNMAGQYCDLVYNQTCGFDHVYTQYKFAEDNELTAGKTYAKKWLLGHEDVTFNEKKLRETFLNDEKLRFALYDTTIPLLERQLSAPDTNETRSIVDFAEALVRLRETQDLESYDDIVDVSKDAG